MNEPIPKRLHLPHPHGISVHLYRFVHIRRILALLHNGSTSGFSRQHMFRFLQFWRRKHHK